MKFLENFAKPCVSALFASVTFVDGVELGVKIISGLSALFVAYLAWLSYKSRKTLERVQRELAEENLQQLRNKIRNENS